MQCPRCHGPMVSERFEDLQDDTGVVRFNAWRCLNCGEVSDAVILANRTNPPSMEGRGDGRRNPRLRVA